MAIKYVSGMKKLAALILLAFVSLGASAQEVAVVKEGFSTGLKPATDFAFIEQKTDPATYKFVATYKAVATGKKASIPRLFQKIAEQAKKDGATCFKVNAYTSNDTTKEAVLVLDTYYWNDSARITNFNNHEKNRIYIFGSLNPWDDDKVSVKINNEKRTIPANKYYMVERTQGETVKISKGGITGMSASYTLTEDKPDIFLTLSGLVLADGPMPPNMAGVALNTGRINNIPGDLGSLLAAILKPATEQ